MSVSKNKGPQNRPQYTMILAIKTRGGGGGDSGGGGGGLAPVVVHRSSRGQSSLHGGYMGVVQDPC